MVNNKSFGKIPIHRLKTNVLRSEIGYSEEIFSGKIEGLSLFHKIYTVKGKYTLTFSKNCAVFIIGLKGKGTLLSNFGQQILEKESLVVLPFGTDSLDFEITGNEAFHFIEFSKEYSNMDKSSDQSFDLSLRDFYFAKFENCKPYTEEIKSPDTISRTVLPSGIIPRVALGTVESKGPDKVGEHAHPMLEQLFLGLENNNITVHADDSFCKMGEYSLLHIPLGSKHWVEVEKGCKMNYMWMDFFLTKAGEKWLETHQPIDERNAD